MKSYRLINLLSLLLVVLLALPSLAQGESLSELKSQLTKTFDALVLDAKNASTFVKQSASVNTDIGNQQETVLVATDWPSWDFRGLGYGSFEIDPKAEHRFDAAGNFIATYIYRPATSRVTGTGIRRTFTFTAASIKGLFDEASAHELEQTRKGSKSAAELAADAAYISDERCDAAAVVVAQTDASSERSALVLRQATSSQTLAGFADGLTGIAALSRTLATAVAESDHLYTTVFTGCDGLKNVSAGYCTANPVTMAHGAIQLLVAARSGARAYDAFCNKNSESAIKLLTNIEGSAKQIEAFSSEMDGLFGIIRENLESVNKRLDALVAWRAHLEKKIGGDEGSEYSQVLESIQLAISEAELAAQAFKGFEKASDKIVVAWKGVNLLFSAIKELLSVPGDPKEFKATMLLVAKRIETIQLKMEDLAKCMQEQQGYALEATEHTRKQNGYYDNAVKLMTTMRANDEARIRELQDRLIFLEKELEASREIVEQTMRAVLASQHLNDSIRGESASIIHDAELAKGEVRKMYTTTDILAGALVAFFVPGGALYAIPVALLTAQGSQTLRNLGVVEISSLRREWFQKWFFERSYTWAGIQRVSSLLCRRSLAPAACEAAAAAQQ